MKLRELVDGYVATPADAAAAAAWRAILAEIDAEWASLLGDHELSTLGRVIEYAAVKQVITNDSGLRLAVATFALGREFGCRAERLEG